MEHRDYLVEEIERLFAVLKELDPTSTEYSNVIKLLWGSGGKGNTSGLIGALLATDESAAKILNDEAQIDIEKMKTANDFLKYQEQLKAEAAKNANEARRLDIEEERAKNEKAANDRKIEIDQFEAETKAREVDSREHMTLAEAKARRRELGFKGLIIFGSIGLTAAAQHSGILDKTLVHQWPKIAL